MDFPKTTAFLLLLVSKFSFLMEISFLGKTQREPQFQLVQAILLLFLVFVKQEKGFFKSYGLF